MTKPINIDAYIAGFPKATADLLATLRATIQQAAPEAGEVISYAMPAFKQNGILVYFAAYASHIGFYPTASGISAFKNDLSGFKSAKGSVQFPLDKPLPLSLITKIVQFKVAENKEKITWQKIRKRLLLKSRSPERED